MAAAVLPEPQAGDASNVTTRLRTDSITGGKWTAANYTEAHWQPKDMELQAPAWLGRSTTASFGRRRSTPTLFLAV
ncbi:hypothetical protein B0A55_13818, partial [Friedmanniomyces simplex]